MKRKENYNKACAVSKYLEGLGLSIKDMMLKGDHRDHQWNSGGKNN